MPTGAATPAGKDISHSEMNHTISTGRLDTRGVKFKGVIDWLELQIKTASPTQFQYIQAALAESLKGKPYVKPLDPSTGKRLTCQDKTTTVFQIRLYDEHANSYREMLKVIEHLEKKHPLIGKPKITGIEFSFDAYCPDDEKLRQVASHFMGHLAAPNIDVRKFDPVRGKTRRIDQWPDIDPTCPDGSLYVLSKAEPLAYRVYLKCTDGKGDDQEGKKLPRDQWRARAEFTLAGKKLEEHGLRTVDDLASVDIAKLGKYLRFANLKSLDEVLEGQNPFVAESIRSVWDERAVCLSGGWKRSNRGQDGYRKHANPDTLTVSRWAEMDYQLNRIVDRESAKLARAYLHDFDRF